MRNSPTSPSNFQKYGNQKSGRGSIVVPSPHKFAQNHSPKISSSSPGAFPHSSHPQLPNGSLEFNGVRPHPPVSHSTDSLKNSPSHKKSKTKAGFMASHNFSSRAQMGNAHLSGGGTNNGNQNGGQINYYMNDKLSSSTIYLLKSQKLRGYSPFYSK